MRSKRTEAEDSEAVDATVQFVGALGGRGWRSEVDLGERGSEDKERLQATETFGGAKTITINDKANEARSK